MKRIRFLILFVVACSSFTLLAQTPAWQPAPGHVTLHCGRTVHRMRLLILRPR